MDIRSLLDNLNLQYHFEINEVPDKPDNDFIIIRSNISSQQDAHAFVTAVESKTNSKFVKYYTRTHPVRILFRKKWTCQHSAYGKRPNSTRNSHCPAFIDIVIKNITPSTMRTDPFLKLPTPLQTIIKLNLQHNHYTDTASSQKMLRVCPEVKKQFQDYFNNGMTPSEARRFHESKVIAEGGFQSLANAAYNPTARQIQRIFRDWKKENYGTPFDPFTKLLEKLQIYESKGATIKYNMEQPWSVLIVTPVMLRAHALPSAEEMIFLDSTTGCDNSNCTVTILVTATKAGAIPIAVLLHQNQTTEGYTTAFTLLKESFPSCFGGKEAPAIFMTDDSAAEKNALRNVWQNSYQFLCHFHVAQAEWRWLTSKNSGITEINDRRDLMKKFQEVMYANTEEKFLEAVEDILKLKDVHDKFVRRFLKHIDRKEEWALLYRLNYFTRNNNTNNLCEATIRILKDVVLNRTKALNIVAIVEFCIIVWDTYLRKKLLEHAHSRVPNHHLMYSSLSAKMAEVPTDEITKIDENTYLVPSSTKKHKYIVITNLGYCTCIAGKTGAFCKHQCFLMQHLGLDLPNAPVLNANDRYILGKLALGDECPEQHFFGDFADHSTELSIPTDHSTEFNLNNNNVNDIKLTYTNTTNITNINLKLENASNDDKTEFLKEINRIINLDIPKQRLKKLTKFVSEIQNTSHLNKKLMCIESAISLINKKRCACAIKVQPTAIQRRKCGVTRGNKRLPSGRPSAATKKNIKKNTI